MEATNIIIGLIRKRQALLKAFNAPKTGFAS
jgi:hypothetical protein